MFSRNLDYWNIVFYDEISLLNKLNFFRVNVYNFKKIDNYKYSFEADRKDRKIIKSNFKDCKIVSRKGLFNYLEVMLSKVTFICVVIAFLFMHNVSKRIWSIETNGDYKQIENVLLDELKKYNLVISKYYPSDDKLKKIENDLSLYLSKEIEFIELRRKGSIIYLRYQKRRTSILLPEKKSNLYATKDGMIRYFDVASGVKKVKENDYVRKGDLLVSEVVETSSGDLINVGTLGSVYANTFYVIEVSLEYDEEDEASIFSKLLDKAKVKISTYLSKGEKIEIERVLRYSLNGNKGEMKVYYMLLEDITI